MSPSNPNKTNVFSRKEGIRAPGARLNHYFEAEVLNADPVKLVTLLYRGALDAIASARQALAAGEIAPRARQIQKAWDIVNELRQSLREDSEPGPSSEISRQLAELYVYVGQRLLDANSEQSERPLIDAASVLTILAEAWQGVQNQQAVPSAFKTNDAGVQADDRIPLSLAC